MTTQPDAPRGSVSDVTDRTAMEAERAEKVAAERAKIDKADKAKIANANKEAKAEREPVKAATADWTKKEASKPADPPRRTAARE